MRKNVASQVIAAQLVSKTDGTAVTSGTTTVYVTGDGGTQGAGSGTVTHEGNGCWSYVPTQAETNYGHVAFTFVNSTAVNVTIQGYTTGYDPNAMVAQTGDAYAIVNHGTYGNSALNTKLGTPAGASVSADIAGVQSDTNDIQTRIPAALTAGGNIKADALAWAGTATATTDIALKDTLAKGTDITGFNDPTAAANADAVWDEARVDHVAAGSFGQGAASIQGNVTGSVASVTGAVGSVTADVGITQAAADKVWNTTARTLTSFGTLVSDIWAYSTRTLTAFSTALALSIWDVLESAIVTASSIGMKVKTNLDATVSAVKAKTDNLPADPASNTQVNTRLATSGYTAPDNAGITAIKAKTDTIVWTDITDIKDESLGKWSINKSTNVLTMYKADGVTILKQFNLTDNASVSERVPV